MTENPAAGATLGDLAGRPELALHNEALQTIHRVLKGDPELPAADHDGWAELDLVATFGRPEDLLTVPKPRHPLRVVLDAAPSVLAFLPILLTWVGMANATAAYRGLRADEAAQQRIAGASFLELWQSGFDGRLWPVLRFGPLAIAIVASIALLIFTNLLSSGLRRRDDQAALQRRDQVRRELLPVLTQAQVEFNRRRLGSPARFAAELSKTAIHLGQLMDRALQTQDSTAELARQNAAVSGQMQNSIVQLQAAIGTLQSTGEGVRAATVALEGASTVLRDKVTTRAAAAAERLDVAARSTAEQVHALQVTGEQTLSGVSQRIEAALQRLTSQVDTATAALAAAGEQYARTIADTAETAATGVKVTYQEAIAAAAATLADIMARSTTGVSTALSAANTQLLGATADSVAGLNAALSSATANLQSLMTDTTAGLHAAMGTTTGDLKNLVTSTTTGLQAAVADAAADLRASHTNAVAQLEASYAAATERLEAHHAAATQRLEASHSAVAERLEKSQNAAAARIAADRRAEAEQRETAATQLQTVLTAAAARLDESHNAAADRMAAGHRAETERQAAAATQLQAALTASAAELRSVLERLMAGADEYREAAREHTRTLAGHSGEIGASAGRIESAVDSLRGSVSALGATVADYLAAPPRPAPPRPPSLRRPRTGGRPKLRYHPATTGGRTNNADANGSTAETEEPR